MQQKARDEFAARQAQRALPALGIGATPECCLVVLDADDALIGNRHPMRIAPEIVQHRLRPAQRSLVIDLYPVIGVEALLEALPPARIEEIMQMPLKAQAVQAADELAAKYPGEYPHRKQESTTCIARLASCRSNGISWPDSPPLTKLTNVRVYFADPHSPWQRGINENTSGLLRQDFPRATDLSRFSQAELDAGAWELNTRPRKSLNWRCPSEVFMPEAFDFFRHYHQLVALRT